MVKTKILFDGQKLATILHAARLPIGGRSRSPVGKHFLKPVATDAQIDHLPLRTMAPTTDPLMGSQTNNFEPAVHIIAMIRTWSFDHYPGI